MTHKYQYVWILAPSKSFEPTRIRNFTFEFIKAGYTFSPMIRKLIHESPENPTSLMTFSLYREPSTPDEEISYTPPGIYDEVKKYLKKCDIYYFAMVASEECLCVWDINSASFDDNEFKIAQEVN